MLYQKFKKKIEKVPIKTLPKTQLEMIYQYAKKKIKIGGAKKATKIHEIRLKF